MLFEISMYKQIISIKIDVELTYKIFKVHNKFFFLGG